MLVKPPRGSMPNLLNPIYKDLRGFWVFNEYTGPSVFDYSRQGNIGAFQGTEVWDCCGMKLNGTSDYIELGRKTVLDVKRITCEIYLVPHGNNGGNYGGLYQDTYNTAYGRNRILLGNAGNLLCQFYIPNTSTTVSTTAPNGSVPNNILSRVVFRYDGSFAVLFTGNTKHTPVAASGDIDINNQQSANIGCGSIGLNTYYLNATVYMARLWGRGLSDSEIMRLGADPFVGFN